MKTAKHALSFPFMLVLVCLAGFAGNATNLLAQEVASERVLVRVLPSAEVYGNSYTLGEIAEMDGFDIPLMRELASIEIGRSPLPGRSLRLSQSIIRTRIRRQGIADERILLQLSQSAQVTRAASEVSGDVVAQMVLEFAAAEASVHPEDLQQEVRSKTPTAVLPRGEPEWHISALGRHASASGERNYLVVAKVDGRDAWRTTVRLHQKIYREVVLAARTIRRNAIITADDVRIERRPQRSAQPETLLSSVADAVGRQARRAIGPNEPLRTDLLTQPHAVQEGGRVEVVYNTTNVRLQVTGVALVSGHLGDFIPVRNLQSGKVIYGVVEAPELVRVN